MAFSASLRAVITWRHSQEGAAAGCRMSPGTSAATGIHHTRPAKYHVNSGDNSAEKATHDEGVREALVKRHHIIEELDLLGREGDIEGLEVGLQMFDLATSDDGEHVGHFLHSPRYGNYTTKGK